jgi:hypothetical protein
LRFLFFFFFFFFLSTSFDFFVVVVFFPLHRDSTHHQFLYACFKKISLLLESFYQ